MVFLLVPNVVCPDRDAFQVFVLNASSDKRWGMTKRFKHSMRIEHIDLDVVAGRTYAS